MVRFALFLVAATGCNAIFGLSEQTPNVQACGPYATPVPVVFDGAALEGAYDLSLDETGTHGLVRVGSGPNPAIHAIVQMPDGSYAEDPARQTNLGANGMIEARLAATVNHVIGGTMMGTLDPNVAADLFAAVLPTQSSDLQVQHFVFRTKAPLGWVGLGTAVDDVPGASVHPGNELELATESPTLFTRYLPVVRVDGATNARTVGIDETLPNDAVWMPERVDHVPVADEINSVHVVQQAVLAFGSLASTDPNKPGLVNHPLTLVYNATTVDSTDSAPRLFASPKTAAGYGVGTRVELAFDDGEILEPWVNTDCTTLWFRRGATVYRADAR